MSAAVGRSVVAFGAGVALSAAFFSIRASHPTEPENHPPVVPLRDICVDPERYVGREVTVSGRVASEIQLEYCEQIGTEWLPIFDPKNNTVHTERIEFIRPAPLGYWWRMRDPVQSDATMLVFTPDIAESAWQPSTEGGELISFPALSRIRVDGTPYLEAVVSHHANAPTAPRSIDGPRYIVPFDPLEGWVSPLRELSVDPNAPAVTVEDLHRHRDRYQGSTVTLVGPSLFLGVEAHTSRRRQGLSRFQTPEQLSSESVAQATAEYMRSAPIVVAAVWYQVAVGDLRVLVFTEEGALPRNVSGVRGEVSYHSDGTPVMAVQSYSAREAR